MIQSRSGSLCNDNVLYVFKRVRAGMVYYAGQDSTYNIDPQDACSGEDNSSSLRAKTSARKIAGPDV
jgi:hypothetical protein